MITDGAILSRPSGADLDPPVDELIAEITDVHHERVRDQVRRLDRVSRNIRVDGDNDDPVAIEIRQLVQGLSACVESQLEKEEQVLFPMLRRLRYQTLITRCHAGRIRSLVSMAERDLARIRGVMVRLRDLALENLSFTPDCSWCSQLRAIAEEVLRDLRDHDDRELRLFSWAMAREEALTR